MEKGMSKAPWEIIYLLKSKNFLEQKENMDQIHRYLIECCKRIWILIPDKGSRDGILAAEQYLDGELSWEEAIKSDYYSEGSAFLFEYMDSTNPTVAKHLKLIRKNLEKCESLLCPPQNIDNIQELLMEAAYFANEALCYPNIRFGINHKKSMENIGKFLPMDLFKRIVRGSLYEAVL